MPDSGASSVRVRSGWLQVRTAQAASRVSEGAPLRFGVACVIVVGAALSRCARVPRCLRLRVRARVSPRVPSFLPPRGSACAFVRMCASACPYCSVPVLSRLCVSSRELWMSGEVSSRRLWPASLSDPESAPPPAVSGAPRAPASHPRPSLPPPRPAAAELAPGEQRGPRQLLGGRLSRTDKPMIGSSCARQAQDWSRNETPARLGSGPPGESSMPPIQGEEGRGGREGVASPWLNLPEQGGCPLPGAFPSARCDCFSVSDQVRRLLKPSRWLTGKPSRGGRERAQPG